MKHSMKITLVLMFFFVITQMLGLYIINRDISVITEDGINIEISHKETILGERPDLEPKDSFLSIVLAILFGTILALILIKLKWFYVWNLWFFFAVFFSMSIALGVFLPSIWAFFISLILALLKYFKTNIFTHNVSELLIYPGISLIFVPLLNIFWMIVLLTLISIYDIYAVQKSKHMIKLAEFQSDTNKFAGFLIDYDFNKKNKKVNNKKNVKNKKTEKAVLGGGDIFFPLLFSGVFMEHLILNNNLDKSFALLLTLIVTLFTTITLFILFYKSEKGKYYPAMPFITSGCFLGYFVVTTILYFI